MADTLEFGRICILQYSLDVRIVNFDVDYDHLIVICHLLLSIVIRRPSSIVRRPSSMSLSEPKYFPSEEWVFFDLKSEY